MIGLLFGQILGLRQGVKRWPQSQQYTSSGIRAARVLYDPQRGHFGTGQKNQTRNATRPSSMMAATIMAFSRA
jgi:hypothetical protein